MLNYSRIHGCRQRGAGGRAAPWIFIHDRNIVDRGLKVLFSAFFAIFSVFFPLTPHPLWKRLNSAVFLITFGIFSVGPPGKFSADALGRIRMAVYCLNQKFFAVSIRGGHGPDPESGYILRIRIPIWVSGKKRTRIRYTWYGVLCIECKVHMWK